MKTWVVSALVGLFVQSAKAQLTTWDNQLFDFGWEPYDPTIVRCSRIPITWNDRATANPASTGPYTISVLQAGSQPIVIATEPSHAYAWTVALPVGGPYALTIEDAHGYTGGTSLVFNVQDAAAGVTCGASSTIASNSLQVTSSGTNAECSTLVVTTQGGTAPYTMQIYVGQRPPKTTTWTTSTMSYTIDVRTTEQFFVLVTDANGLAGVDGIHTVTNGDAACYSQATTVVVGATPTTLSYNPSSTVSIPGGSSSSSSSRSSSRVIQNTGTTTVVSTITLDDGSSSAYTIPPGSSATIIDSNNSQTMSSTNNLPAIIGGAVGGAALLVILIIILLWHRRRSAQQAFAREQNGYGKPPFSPIGPQPMPFEGSHISPFTPPITPGRDTAPLMAHMNSMYSNGSRGSALTPAPSTPGMSYFGNNGYVGAGVPTHASASPENPPVWAIPTAARQGSMDATNYTSSSSSPPLVGRSNSVWSGEGIPPGAMAPKAPSWGGSAEKATFVSSRPGTVAPPPYSQGG